jgi:hypothetical protein
MNDGYWFGTDRDGVERYHDSDDTMAARTSVLHWRPAETPRHLVGRNQWPVTLCGVTMETYGQSWAAEYVDNFPGVFEDEPFCSACLRAFASTRNARFGQPRD